MSDVDENDSQVNSSNEKETSNDISPSYKVEKDIDDASEKNNESLDTAPSSASHVGPDNHQLPGVTSDTPDYNDEEWDTRTTSVTPSHKNSVVDEGKERLGNGVGSVATSSASNGSEKVQLKIEMEKRIYFEKQLASMKSENENLKQQLADERDRVVELESKLV